MQSLFAAIHADEIAAVRRCGGRALVPRRSDLTAESGDRPSEIADVQVDCPRESPVGAPPVVLDRVSDV
jgi:hypothetical protein